MTAPQRLLPETERVEAVYEKLKGELRDLDRQYDRQEREAQTALEAELSVINARFAKQRAEIAPQLEPSLRQTIEQVLRQKRDLEADAVRRTHQDQAKERKMLYDAQKAQGERELFLALDAVVAGRPDQPDPSPRHPPQLSTLLQARHSIPVITARTPTSQEHALPSKGLITSPVSAQASSPPAVVAAKQETAVNFEQRARVAEYSVTEAPHSLQPPAEPVKEPVIASDQDTLPSDSPASDVEAEQPTGISEVASEPEPEPVNKRKAKGEPNGDPSADRIKRARLETAANNERTITFREVFGSENNQPQYKHVIVQFPSDSGHYYILRCDEHGVHFGEHPLRGAAKHLASAQHNYMSKAHATAIEMLGHRVVDCTQELADKNNKEVLRDMKSGAYKPFNANTLNQSRRAMLGYPPLDPLTSGKAAAQRKSGPRITNPVPCRFYLANGEPRCPVLILPWGDTAPAGLVGTLADTGIFREVSDDGKQLAVPKLPKCYVYDVADGRVRGIKGWAEGYEDGGPLEKRREFPVLCAENSDYRYWAVGWVKASHLSPLNFSDPNVSDIPFCREARDYYFQRIVRYETSRGNAAHNRPQPSAANTMTEDVEMEDAAMTDNNARRDPRNRLSTILTRNEAPSEANPRDMGAVKSISAPPSPGTSARMIAAQALNLQTPSRSSAFKPINASNHAGSSASRDPSPNRDLPSRPGSVSGAGGGRRVLKIHARSSRPNPASQAAATPSIVLPERPAEGTPTRTGASGQPQTVERTASPASLQHILQTPASGTATPRISSQSPKPAGARHPLPSAPMRSLSQSRPALLSSQQQQQMERESRAGSAPVQLPQKKSPSGEDIRHAETPSTASSSRHGTPQTVASAPSPPATTATAVPPVAQTAASEVPAVPAAAAAAATPTVPIVASPAPTASLEPVPVPEPVETRVERPQIIQLPPLPAILSQPPQMGSSSRPSPLTSPAASATDTRSNSPNLPLQHPQTASTTASFPAPITVPIPAPLPEVAAPNSGLDTPALQCIPSAASLTPTLSEQVQPQPPPSVGFLPTMDVFDLVGFMEGTTEVYRSPAPGEFLRLIDDHKTGVLKTADDEPVSVRVEARRIKVVERMGEEGGVRCVVRVVYHADNDDSGNGGEERTQTLVLDKARSTSSGMQTGMVHARRFCRRVQHWNDGVDCPAPGSMSGEVLWRSE
ncbi:hypothetical protein VTI74DRAFT_10598 [Chaetomium olivicolor]